MVGIFKSNFIINEFEETNICSHCDILITALILAQVLKPCLQILAISLPGQ